MIAFVKWAIRFIVWILLYYIINYKIFNTIADQSVINLQKFNLFVLYLSIGLSFAMSFHGKMISFRNIKYHLYVALSVGIIPISITILNWSINILNIITPYVNAPLLKLIEWKLSIEPNLECGCEILKGFSMGFMVITVISLIMVIMHSYIWEASFGDYNNDHWDDDLDEY